MKAFTGKEKRVNFFSGWPQVTPCSHCLWNYWSLLSLKNYSYRISYASLIYFKKEQQNFKNRIPIFFLTVASPAQVCWCNFQSTKKCLRSYLSQVSQIQDQWKNELFIWSGMRFFFPSFLVIKISFVWLKLNLSPGWVYLCTIYACFMHQQHTALLVVCAHN